MIRFLWFTHFCRKILSQEFTHFFRRFFYLKSKIRRHFFFGCMIISILKALQLQYATKRAIANNFHQKHSNKEYYANCIENYAKCIDDICNYMRYLNASAKFWAIIHQIFWLVAKTVWRHASLFGQISISASLLQLTHSQSKRKFIQSVCIITCTSYLVYNCHAKLLKYDWINCNHFKAMHSNGMLSTRLQYSAMSICFNAM